MTDKLHKREKTSLILSEAYLITSSIFTPYQISILCPLPLVYICRLKVLPCRDKVTETLTKRRSPHAVVALSCGGFFKGLYSQGDSRMRHARRRWEREKMSDPAARAQTPPSGESGGLTQELRDMAACEQAKEVVASKKAIVLKEKEEGEVDFQLTGSASAA